MQTVECYSYSRRDARGRGGEIMKNRWEQVLQTYRVLVELVLEAQSVRGTVPSIQSNLYTNSKEVRHSVRVLESVSVSQF